VHRFKSSTAETVTGSVIAGEECSCCLPLRTIQDCASAQQNSQINQSGDFFYNWFRSRNLCSATVTIRAAINSCECIHGAKNQRKNAGNPDDWAESKGYMEIPGQRIYEQTNYEQSNDEGGGMGTGARTRHIFNPLVIRLLVIRLFDCLLFPVKP